MARTHGLPPRPGNRGGRRQSVSKACLVTRSANRVLNAVIFPLLYMEWTLNMAPPLSFAQIDGFV
jgi:hypothetical protein